MSSAFSFTKTSQRQASCAHQRQVADFCVREVCVMLNRFIQLVQSAIQKTSHSTQLLTLHNRVLFVTFKSVLWNLARTCPVQQHASSHDRVFHQLDQTQHHSCYDTLDSTHNPSTHQQSHHHRLTLD